MFRPARLIKNLQRLLLIAFGAALGAVLIVLLVHEVQQRRREQSGPSSLAHRPPTGILLRPPQGETAIMTPAKPTAEVDQLPLKIAAKPAAFIRRRAGTIRVETLAGATCTLKATYSTGRAPSSLDGSISKAGENGRCEWTWEIGTSGDHVEVEVEVRLKGHEPVHAKKRVRIVDAS
jgi:hypothetical protein